MQHILLPSLTKQKVIKTGIIFQVVDNLQPVVLQGKKQGTNGYPESANFLLEDH